MSHLQRSEEIEKHFFEEGKKDNRKHERLNHIKKGLFLVSQYLFAIKIDEVEHARGKKV